MMDASLHGSSLKQRFKRGEHDKSLPKWKIEWQTLLAARVLASDARPSGICLRELGEMML